MPRGKPQQGDCHDDFEKSILLSSGWHSWRDGIVA
jgi:hypothetical protein